MLYIVRDKEKTGDFLTQKGDTVETEGEIRNKFGDNWLEIMLTSKTFYAEFPSDGDRCLCLDSISQIEEALNQIGYVLCFTCKQRNL